MVGQLNFTNLFVQRRFGQHFYSSYLVNKAAKFTAVNFAECVFTEEFLLLDEVMFMILMSRSNSRKI